MKCVVSIFCQWFAKILRLLYINGLDEHITMYIFSLNSLANLCAGKCQIEDSSGQHQQNRRWHCKFRAQLRVQALELSRLVSNEGVLGTNEKHGSAVSMGFRIVGTLQGIYALQLIIDNVYDEIFKRLTWRDRDSLTMNLLLEHHVGVEKDAARTITQELQSLNMDVTSIVSLTELKDSRDARCDIEMAIGRHKKKNENENLFLSEFLVKFMGSHRKSCDRGGGGVLRKWRISAQFSYL